MSPNKCDLSRIESYFIHVGYQNTELGQMLFEPLLCVRHCIQWQKMGKVKNLQSNGETQLKTHTHNRMCYRRKRVSVCVVSVASFHCVVMEGPFKVTFKTLKGDEDPGKDL